MAKSTSSSIPPAANKRRSTILDVAAAANVSKTLVARAFASEKGVSADARARIIEAAKQLNYRPNLLARGLRHGRTHAVSVLWGIGTPSTWSTFMPAFAEHMSACGYTTYTYEVLGSLAAMERALEDALRRQSDAVVMQWVKPNPPGPKLRRLLRSFHVAVGITDRVTDMGIDLVIHDRCEPIRQIAEHLYATGRRRPAGIFPAPVNRIKFEAFQSVWAKYGIPLQMPEVFSDYDASGNVSVIDWVRSQLDKHVGDGRPPFDCAACLGDDVAIGVIDWLKARGVDVPGAVAVTGFDNATFGRYLQPRLATVDRCDAQAARAVSSMIISRLSDGNLKRRIENVPMRFIPRESAGGSIARGENGATSVLPLS